MQQTNGLNFLLFHWLRFSDPISHCAHFFHIFQYENHTFAINVKRKGSQVVFCVTYIILKSELDYIQQVSRYSYYKKVNHQITDSSVYTHVVRYANDFLNSNLVIFRSYSIYYQSHPIYFGIVHIPFILYINFPTIFQRRLFIDLIYSPCRFLFVWCV